MRRWIEYDQSLVNSKGLYTNYKDIDAARRIVGYAAFKDANISPTTWAGMTPLSLAWRRGNKEMIEFLLENGADASIINDHTQSTVLHHAVLSGNVDLVKRMINAGADVNVVAAPPTGRNDGERMGLSSGRGTPLDVLVFRARYMNNVTQSAIDMERMLLEAGGRRTQ
jgi:ankyrin repeat protein